MGNRLHRIEESAPYLIELMHCAGRQVVTSTISSPSLLVVIRRPEVVTGLSDILTVASSSQEINDTEQGGEGCA